MPLAQATMKLTCSDAENQQLQAELNALLARLERVETLLAEGTPAPSQGDPP